MPAPEELVWRRVRRAIDPLSRDLLREANRRFGEAGLDEAWDRFHLSRRDEPFDPASPDNQLFWSWFLHDWKPDPRDTRVPESGQGKTAAQAYVERAGARLDPIARRYVEDCGRSPFSFYEVVACRPGQGFTLHEVMQGGEVDVIEHSGSQHLQPGDVLYVKLASVDGITLIEGMAATTIPPVYKPELIALRQRLGTSASLFGRETLRQLDATLRAAFFDIVENVRNPRRPELRNTDGDLLEMHTLVFDLDAPDAALAALEDLTAGVAAPDVERDGAGNLVRAEFTWSRLGNRTHKDWDNTSLGSIRIEGSRLTADVNSAKRAAALRKTIEKRLGESAHVRPSVVQSMQSLLAREQTPREKYEHQRRAQEQAEFAARPEVRALMRETMRKHYRAWVDEKIPALGNRTPRQAMRDVDGREAVEALIVQFERDGARMSPPLEPEVLQQLRETLGLRWRGAGNGQ